MKYNVAVIRDLDNLYVYSSTQLLENGQIISVNFRNRETVGVVVNDEKTSFHGNVKNISSILPYRISENYLKFAKFIADYNLINIGTVFKLLIPFSVDAILLQEKELKTEGVLEQQSTKLSEEQNKAVLEILKYKNQFKTILLHGITGSGKTEVFLEVAKFLIAFEFRKGMVSEKATEEIVSMVGKTDAETSEEAARCGNIDKYTTPRRPAEDTGQILILIPEIALSTELAKKVLDKFGKNVFTWHNSVSSSKKLAIWKKAINGEKLIVVGARSALFIPFNNLKLIVVDEEHDVSFKQSETAIYNARDLAVYLGRCLNIPVILSSATPSIESYQNAISGKYEHIKLNSRFFKKATLPLVIINDLRTEKRFGNFTSYSIKEINECLQLKKQILIFVNRRGHTPKILCKSCGAKVTCPACSSWLCYHNSSNELICHYCGYKTHVKHICEDCKKPSLIGIGIGIEKVHAECTELFPNARIMMLSSDTINTPNKISKAIEKVKENGVDIILGTQIISKGHNFNNINLVVVVCADTMLYGEDFRTTERAFQMLHQVSGRAGRIGDGESKVIIQTYNPDENLMKILHDRDIEKFYELELANRKLTKMPPFGKIVSITVSSPFESKVINFSKKMIVSASKSSKIKIIGPIQPMMYKLRSRYRMRIIAISDSNFQNYVKDWLSSFKPQRDIRITVDIDPYEFW
ncbi:MAG: primosomal protein N' [Holosporales bacterium]|nr:primosomal protein N' [Holosporales bacterium]